MTSKSGSYMLLLVAAVSLLALTSHSLVISEHSGCIPYTRDIDLALRDWTIATSSAWSSLDPQYRRVVDWSGLLEPLFTDLAFSSTILRPEDYQTLELLQSS